jgi:hypothetical protein
LSLVRSDIAGAESKRERARDKLLSEIEDSVAALVQLVGFPVNSAR